MSADVVETGGSVSPTDIGVPGAIDETSLQAQVSAAAERNRAVTQPYRNYIARVIKESGVRDSQLTRQLTSNICGAIARLPFLPDDKEPLQGEKTEWDLQVEKTAQQAEAMLGSEVVWTVSARKLARTALELRKKDPEGKKNIAWVNEAFDESRVSKVLPRALRGEEPS